jgi:hypothetical protein
MVDENDYYGVGNGGSPEVADHVICPHVWLMFAGARLPLQAGPAPAPAASQSKADLLFIISANTVSLMPHYMLLRLTVLSTLLDTSMSMHEHLEMAETQADIESSQEPESYQKGVHIHIELL